MRSMYEEYYEFLCKRLIAWTNKVEIKPGDRYVLSFEDQKQVKDFMKTLSDSPRVSSFVIGNDVNAYAGLSVQLKQASSLKLIVVSTIGVTADYLVNLRNQIGRQQGKWDNTALLFISNQILDSINSGAKDISRQGGPFNIDELRKNVISDVRDTDTFNVKEKEVLCNMVDASFKGEQTYTLMDFADAYSIIEKGHLDNSDYQQMGYFSDKSLLTYDDDDIAERLMTNRDDFAEVRTLQGFGDVKESLSKMVTGSTLVNDLASDEWQKVDYGRILTGKAALKRNSQVKINYLGDQFKKENANFTIWDQPKSKTAAGERNRHLIIFNPNNLSDIEIRIPFDQSLSKNGLSKRVLDNKNPKVSVFGNHLRVAFDGLKPRTSAMYKFSYKHQSNGTLTFTFSILILPLNSNVMADIRPFYTLNVQAHQTTIKLPSNMDDFELGAGEETRLIDADSVGALNNLNISSRDKFSIKMRNLLMTDEKEDHFTLTFLGIPVHFSFVDEDKKVVPRNAVYIENFRRQNEVDGHYQHQQLVFGGDAFSVFEMHKRYLEIEKDLLENSQLSSLFPDLPLSQPLKQDYLNLFDALRARGTLMSLVSWDTEIKSLVRKILDEVIHEIDWSADRIEPSPEIRNIARIGEVSIQSDIGFAPFSPILLGYQLQVEEDVGREDLSDTIQRKLNPIHLAPFLQRQNDYFRADYVSNAPRWLIYSNANLSKTSEASQKIITERLKDFKKHFKFLFEDNHNQFNVHAVNIRDERALLKSVTDYLIFEISQNKDYLSNINPVTLYISNSNERQSRFGSAGFYNIHDKKTYEAYFQDSIKTITDLEPEQVIELVQNNLNIVYGDNQAIDYHITFYQFTNRLVLGQYDTSELNMNYSIGGLIGGDEYTRVQNSIRNGFGTKGLGESKTDIIELAESWNDLLVATAHSHSVMAHGQALTNNVEELDDDNFQQQFDHSKWVTLLNPLVKLDYFNKMNQDIYVIHYTDYTNSANYESITLTKQVNQYELILSENLPDIVDQRHDTTFVNKIIKSFNVVNGEWLLRLVSHRDQQNTVKEKLSILATFKEMLGILATPSVQWIPLSLEEILRVAGSFVGETREDSIFSAKSLGATGSISDDLLFIGLWYDGDQLKVSFLPTEVKVGQNNNSVKKKAREQVEHTFKVLNDTIFNANGFKADFYLDFFMKLFFANVAKFFSNGDMDQATYNQIQQAKQAVSQGKLVVDNSATDFYKNKAIFSLKADETNRMLQITDNCVLVQVPESDAFRFSGATIQEVVDDIQNDKFGFNSERLLKNVWQANGHADVTATDTAQTEAIPFDQSEVDKDVSNKSVSETVSDTDNESSLGIAAIHQFEDTIDAEETVSALDTDATPKGNTVNNALEDVVSSLDNYQPQHLEDEVQSSAEQKNQFAKDDKILLGTIDGSTSKAYWEYNHPQLANRHMLITGKSGQGKTYFMQTLLMEFAKRKIDTLVIDYTDSYLPDQLKKTLTDFTEIYQHIVKLNKLPINPFKYNDISIGTETLKETTSDVVSRVAEVLDFKFNLGVQQKSTLIKVMNEGMSATSKYTFSTLKQQIQDDKDYATLFGRLQPILDNDPFDYSNQTFDWASYFGQSGQINIIQLTQYPDTVQKAIIEFLLWDLFNYSRMNSDKELVYPVFLDEVQNLSFKPDSPIVKILREGRKFGWSGIFATQSLKSIKDEVDAIYNAAEQIHFLPPENQTMTIASMLTSDKDERKGYTTALTKLKKGQCIVSGPALDAHGQLGKSVTTVDIDSLEERLGQ